MVRTADGWLIGTKTVVIADNCPFCHGPRSVPKNYHFCEDGEWYDVDVWLNLCGHVDMYSAVLVEAYALQDPPRGISP